MRMKEGHLTRSMFESHVGGERMLGRRAGVAASDVLLSLDFTTTSQPADLDTYNRASACAPITGSGAGGVEVTKFSSGQYAYAYDANFSHGSKLGMLVEPASTNLVTYSEDITDVSWSKNGTTATGNQATAPDGTSTADELSFPATANQNLTTTFSSVGAGNFTHSIFMRAKTGTATVDLIHVDGSTEDVTLTCNLTESWQRFETTNNNGATTNRLRISNASHGAQDIYVWGAQCESGVTVATSYIPTSGATATRVRTDPQVTNLYSKSFIDHSIGRIETVYVPYVDHVSDQYYWRLEVASNLDRKLCRSNSGGNFIINDGAGTQIASINNGSPTTKTAGSEYTRTCSWDETASPSCANTVDADTDTGGATFTSGTGNGTFYIGNANTANFEAEATFATLKIYNTTS